MKGHKANHHRMGRSTGGANEAEEDLREKPERRNNADKIFSAAEERKRGGRAKKHGMKAEGPMAKHHAGRKPRKNGGRTGSDSMPFSSARHGTDPAGHKTDLEMD